MALSTLASKGGLDIVRRKHTIVHNMRMDERSVADALWPVTRRRVLGLLLADPEQEWHLREIVRRTELAPATVQREVLSLAEAGILARRREGRQVYYRADPACPIFPDLQAIVLKTVGLADVLRNALEPLRQRIAAAFVFGSVAEGTSAGGSDVDLMVITRASLADVVEALRPAQERLGREINPVRVTPKEFKNRLAEGDHFLRTVLDRPKLFLIGDQDAVEGLADERPPEEA